MFCFQCEQTAGGKGCAFKHGVCGKTEEVAALQDALRQAAASVAWYATRNAAHGAHLPLADRFVVNALFTTITNVDFDPARLEAMLHEGWRHREDEKALYLKDCHGAGHSSDDAPAGTVWSDFPDREGWLDFGAAHGVAARRERFGPAIAGVLEMAVYGLKGACAYAHHATALATEDSAWYARLHEELAWLTFVEAPTLDDALAHALAVGEVNLQAMAMLDRANTGTYGHPEPTAVRVTPVAGKAILVSGHDLKDLHDLLVQTEGQGIHIYTHGEMLPCHAYPKLKAFKHLVGHFGGAWQEQQKEFPDFPGPILLTTNCIQRPKPDYHDRIFTTGLVAWEGVTHVMNGEFAPVIAAALAAPGFAADEPGKAVTVGFGRHAVLGVADKVVDAVKAGAIKHFFLVGGCDGAKPGRHYYTEFVEKTPKDTVVLTLACGKYRFNKMDLGDIGGIPRLLDVGQCNDAYSAVQIALALANAFGVGVNDLPLSLVLSWYEQKAVAVLLTLLHLGLRNIRLGPTLPAFVEPEVLQALVDAYGLQPIDTAEKDLAAILA